MAPQTPFKTRVQVITVISYLAGRPALQLSTLTFLDIFNLVIYKESYSFRALTCHFFNDTLIID